MEENVTYGEVDVIQDIIDRCADIREEAEKLQETMQAQLDKLNNE